MESKWNWLFELETTYSLQRWRQKNTWKKPRNSWKTLYIYSPQFSTAHGHVQKLNTCCFHWRGKATWQMNKLATKVQKFKIAFILKERCIPMLHINRDLCLLSKLLSSGKSTDITATSSSVILAVDYCMIYSIHLVWLLDSPQSAYSCWKTVHTLF